MYQRTARMDVAQTPGMMLMCVMAVVTSEKEYNSTVGDSQYNARRRSSRRVVHVRIMHEIQESATTSDDDAHAVTLIPWQRAAGPFTVMLKQLATWSTDIVPVHTHSSRTLSTALLMNQGEARHLKEGTSVTYITTVKERFSLRDQHGYEYTSIENHESRSTEFWDEMRREERQQIREDSP